MPEGHILHRLARLHHEWYSGAPVRVSSPQGRFADGAAAVDGRVLTHADAWGKHLFHHYEGGLAVHVHLGIYGEFTDRELPLGEPVGQVRMRMIGARHGSDLRGPAACEVLTPGEVESIEARLVNFLEEHERAGNPVAIWRDGRVAIVPASEAIVEHERAKRKP